MTNKKQLTREDAAWTITMGSVRAAAELGHCQLRGVVVARKRGAEPLDDGSYVYSIEFIGSMNSRLDKRIRTSLYRFARKASREYVESTVAQVSKTIKVFDPPTTTTMNVKRNTKRMEVIARSASVDDWYVTVVMSSEDELYAEAFARAMASMLDVGESIVLDRRGPEDKAKDEQSEDQAVPDDGPPTLILAPMRRSVGGL